MPKILQMGANAFTNAVKRAAKSHPAVATCVLKEIESAGLKGGITRANIAKTLSKDIFDASGNMTAKAREAFAKRIEKYPKDSLKDILITEARAFLKNE